MAEQTGSGIELELRFFPLAFFAFFKGAHVVIDDVEYLKGFGLPVGGWGTHYFPLQPGRHAVSVFFPIQSHPRGGYNEINVTVEEGKSTKVWYFLPFHVGWAGVLKEL